jgi:DNA replication and repair protein RecF
LRVASLTISGFRNLEPTTVQWPPTATAVLGENGAGKTSLLEAVAVAANLRSFRCHNLQPLIQFGAPGFRLMAEVVGATGARQLELRVGAGPPVARRLLVDGRAARVAEYLSVCPVFTLTGSDAGLVVGQPRQRRAFLDRLSFLLRPLLLVEARSYQRALSQRNAALSRGIDELQLVAWEGALAAAAAAVIRCRLLTVGRLAGRLREALLGLAGSGFPEVTVGYAAEPWLDLEAGPEALAESLQKRYNDRRARDCQAGVTLEGPHRHDLRLEAGGRPVKDVLSSGQTRVVAAALRLASVSLVEEHRGDRFPVAIDDVDAELDRGTLGNLAAALGSGRQLLVSSAHPEPVVRAFVGARLIQIHAGRCMPAGAAGE